MFYIDTHGPFNLLALRFRCIIIVYLHKHNDMIYAVSNYPKLFNVKLQFYRLRTVKSANILLAHHEHRLSILLRTQLVKLKHFSFVIVGEKSYTAYSKQSTTFFGENTIPLLLSSMPQTV